MPAALAHQPQTRRLRPRLRWRRVLIAALLAGTPSALGSTDAMAQTQAIAQAAAQAPAQAPPREYTQALAQGNKAYNDSQYEKAYDSYVIAIQAWPEGHEAYRNMARACFWLNDYAQAIAYYDVYLVAHPGASDADAVRQERRLAAARASSPFVMPVAQRKALEELELALASSSPGYARGGAGAWRSYDRLLRAGYAWPELAKLRQRLSLKLLLEHDEQLQPKQDQPTPTLDLEAWQLQRERLDAALSVASPDVAESIQKRRLVWDAAQALLMSQYEQAVKKCQEAQEQNPDLLFLRWFLIAAMIQHHSLDQALKTLDAMQAQLQREAPSQLAYAQVVRAMILQKQGQAKEAAALYREALTR